MNDPAKVFLFGPKILAIHSAMREPKGAMVGMVMLLVGDVFHRPIPGRGEVTRANQRIAKWTRHIFEKIFSKECAINLHAQSIVQLFDLDPLSLSAGRMRFGRTMPATVCEQKESSP